MSQIEGLLKEYERFVQLPWERGLAPPRRVWFAIYDPAQERRLRPRLGAFEAATRAAGHGWAAVDLTDAFAEWMAAHEYRDAYFEQPEDMDLALADFAEEVDRRVTRALTSPDVDEDTVVALIGLASLFRLTRVSQMVARIAPQIPGRLLAFFPGRHEESNYYLLDARDGSDYLAVPITAPSGGS